MKRLILVISLMIFLFISQKLSAITYKDRRTEIIANRLEKLLIENTDIGTYKNIILDFENITNEEMKCELVTKKNFIFRQDILEYSNSKVKLWTYINWNDINVNVNYQDFKSDKIVYIPNYKESANIINIIFKGKSEISKRFTIDEYIKWKNKNLFSEVIELYTN